MNVKQERNQMNKLEEIKKKALEEHLPIIMDDTLEVIKEILIKEKPKRLLEIGTAVGYSALCFSQYVDYIDTIEIEEEKVKEAIKNVGANDPVRPDNCTKHINIIHGDAIEILPTFKEKYDIIFIDAAKGKYLIFLEEALKLINNNGIIIADNVLYKGYVLSDYNKHKQRTAVNKLREYIKKVSENPKLKTKILDVGDGLAVSRYIS